jgi:hypothetical protein
LFFRYKSLENHCSPANEIIGKSLFLSMKSSVSQYIIENFFVETLNSPDASVLTISWENVSKCRQLEILKVAINCSYTMTFAPFLWRISRDRNEIWAKHELKEGI